MPRVTWLFAASACALCCCAALLATGGCDSFHSAALPEPKEAEYRKLTKEFATHIQDGEYPEAYEMCSADLKKRQTLAAFTKAHQEALKEYGQEGGTAEIATVIGTTDAEELGSGYYGTVDAPASARRAAIAAQMNFRKTPGNDQPKCYNIWLVIVDDGGKEKVGSYKYEWCD